MDVLMDEQLGAIKPGYVMRTRDGAKVRIEEPLGAGNEGVVFRGRLNGEQVAVKLFKHDGSGRRERRTRALVALNLSRTLSSSIAGPFKALSWEDRVGHVAPLVSGISVQELVDVPSLLTPRQRILATVKLGALVAAMHRHGMAYGDLNKGAVKVKPLGDNDVDVSLVDVDSAVLPGEPAPLTLGTPDTCAPELREGQQPTSIRAWQAADWTAFGHVAMELLLAKTAACGIEDAQAQVMAFMGVPPCLMDSSQGRAIDLAAGLPAQILPEAVRRPLSRLFDVPSKRDGRALVQALATALINNHQVACPRCGLQYLVHHGLHTCPGCGLSASADLKIALPNGDRLRLTPSGVPLGRDAFGGNPRVQRVHARLFLLGGIPFVSAFGEAGIQRAGGQKFLLPLGLHVPLQRGDRVNLAGAVAVMVI